MKSALMKIKLITSILIISFSVRYFLFSEFDVSLRIKIISWAGFAFYAISVLIDLPAQKRLFNLTLEKGDSGDYIKKEDIQNYVKELVKLILLIGIIFNGLASTDWFDISYIVFNIIICAIFLTMCELFRLILMMIFIETKFVR